jgi:hypothetical protein
MRGIFQRNPKRSFRALARSAAAVCRKLLQPCLSEPLEPRLLLSFAAIGTEFLVNTTTDGAQNQPAIASDADGDSVIVWSGNGPGDTYGIFAQRYAASGAPLGGEFRVNTSTPGDQHAPSVAMDADGDFVVTWGNYYYGGHGRYFYDVYAQRYNAAGAPLGAEFRVNTDTNHSDDLPSVAIDADGDFVIAWESYGRDGSGYGISAQRYTAQGTRQGTEFRVNTFTSGNQLSASVAMDAAGDFVVGWISRGQDGSGYDIYAQRYTAAGAPVADEFRVNTVTIGNQITPSLAMDLAGDFVVAWLSDQSGSGYGAYAQRYNAAAVAQGAELFVSTAHPDVSSWPPPWPRVAWMPTENFS